MLHEMIQKAALTDRSGEAVKCGNKRASALHFSEATVTTLINLRGDTNSSEFHSAVERVLQVPLPMVQRFQTAANGWIVNWLGPDEWLIQVTNESEAVLETALRHALHRQACAVVDVSSGYAVFQLRGDHVRDVLAKGCPLDLHPREFIVGQCAQSHYFKSSIILKRTGSNEFEVLLRRSFAEYFQQMLLDAALEGGKGPPAGRLVAASKPSFMCDLFK
jgi:sarcosine oxidase, subunit gamma